MIPRKHIFLGAMFSLIIWFLFPSISFFNIFLIFFFSFIIDIDHYLVYVYIKRNFSLIKSLKYYDLMEEKELQEKSKGIRKKGHFHLLHTIEFHILLAILALFFQPFVFIFIGVFFHSIMDFFDLTFRDMLYRREYFFFKWLLKKYR